MPQDEIPDLSDADARARDLIENALASLESGDEAALRDLEKAESIAEEAGIPGLVAAARINRGFVLANRGDYEEAAQLFADATVVAREAGNTDRLRSALSNLGVVLRLAGHFHEAIAVYSELAEVSSDDPGAAAHALIDRGLCYVEQARHGEAMADFERAEELARGAEMFDLAAIAHGSQAFAQEQNGDPTSASLLAREAVDIARQSGNDDVLAQSLVDLAQGYRRLGQHSEALPVFAEAEEIFRRAGHSDALADTLYWHGISLREAGETDRALALWQEEEPLRRESGDDAGLADCLLAQAAIIRDRGDFAEAEALYVEAEDLCRRHDIAVGLASALYNHGKLMRADGRSEELLPVVSEAVDVAVEVGFAEIECRARTLRAMALTDMGDTAGASAELDAAESLGMQLGFYKQLTWMMARRAYVLAREGRPAEEVAAPLRLAHQFASDQKIPATGRSAVKVVVREIKERVGDAYDEALDGVRAEIRASKNDAQPPS